MSLLTDLKKFKSETLVMFTMLFAATVPPGFLIAAFFKPALFMDLGFGSLVVFAIAFTSPIIFSLFLASYILTILFETEAEREDRAFETIFCGASIAFLSFYALLTFGYLYDWNFKYYIKVNFSLVGGTWLVIIVGLLALAVKRKVSKKEEK